MIVKVKQRDLNDGKQRVCSSCPIALAVNRDLKEGCYATVGRFQVNIWKDDKYTSYDAPSEVHDFVKGFDGVGNVAPFNFLLPVDKRFLKNR